MDRVKFTVACIAGVVALLGFFYLITSCVASERQSDIHRQQSCVENGLQYVYDSHSGQYNCLYHKE